MKSKILLLVLLVSLAGCITIGKSDSQVKRDIKRVDKAITKIETAVKPPVKPWKLYKSEMDILAYTLKDIQAAKGTMNPNEYTKYLNAAIEKIVALQSSVGLSSEDLGKLKEKTIERRMAKFRRDVANHKSEKYHYIQAMRDYKLQASTLTDAISKQKSVIQQLIFWLWVAVIVSVLFMVCIPGGGAIVSRFWKAGFSMTHMLAKKSYQGLCEMTKGINDMMEITEP